MFSVYLDLSFRLSLQLLLVAESSFERISDVCRYEDVDSNNIIFSIQSYKISLKCFLKNIYIGTFIPLFSSLINFQECAFDVMLSLSH